MSDSPSLSESDEPPFEGLPIIEDSGDRKVIQLAPRGGMPVIGLGCTISLFIPAAIISVLLILPGFQVEAPWLLGLLWILTISAPIALIQWYQTVRDSEESLILEPGRITLRSKSFDRRTGTLVESNDESVDLGPGSGLTTEESWSESDNKLLTVAIWGPSGSLSVSTDHDALPWVREQIRDWLRRHVFTKTNPRPLHNINSSEVVAVDQTEGRQDQVAVGHSRPRHRRTQITEAPPNGLVTVTDENSSELQIHIAAGGPEVVSFGWNSFSLFLFATAFGILWFLVAGDLGLTPNAILFVVWLGSVGLMCVWIRRLFESVDLHLTIDRLIVTRTLFGWSRRHEVTFGPSPTVVLEVSEWHGSTPKPTLFVKGSDGEARFGKMLSNQEKRWLVMLLRAFLNLDLRTNLFAVPEGQADS